MTVAATETTKRAEAMLELARLRHEITAAFSEPEVATLMSRLRHVSDALKLVWHRSEHGTIGHGSVNRESLLPGLRGRVNELEATVAELKAEEDMAR